IGEYGPGIEITARNQVFRREIAPGQFELYRPGANLDLPYTTTGDWEEEGDQFVAVGDHVLRQQLADSSDPEKGAAMVSYVPGENVRQAIDRFSVEIIEAKDEAEAYADMRVGDGNSLASLGARASAGQPIRIAIYGDSTTGGTNTSDWTANAIDG